MSVRIISVGGFNEVGKNMCAVIVDDEAVILDMGIYLPAIIGFEEEEGHRNLDAQGMIKIGAIPDDSVLDKYRNKVKAIVLGHCHLDHIGAVPYLASKYDCPIIGTPYTMEVLKNMLNDDKQQVTNKFKTLNPNSNINISQNLNIEFVHMTHSTLQTMMVVIHTKYGDVIYANDFKLDLHPVVGQPPNFKRIKELGKGNVIALVVDSLYAAEERKTPSERVTREMLKDVLLGTSNENNLIVITTFSSHIERLKSIIDFGKKLDRNILFLGRSLMKYVKAAENINLVNYSKEVEIYGYRNEVKKALRDLRSRDETLIVCTGNQAEPGSVLNRMVNKELPFKFMPEDHVIFSSRTIPVPVNIANRSLMEEKLKKYKTRIFTNIHNSGHCGREDLRDLINMLRPKHIIPAHGDLPKLNALVELGTEIGYIRNKTVHIVQDSMFLDVK